MADTTHTKLAGDSMSTPDTKGANPLNENPPKLVREAFGLMFQYMNLQVSVAKNGAKRKVPSHAMYQPNYNDFEFKPDEIKERMADGSMAKHIGIDTREIAQVDIDRQLEIFQDRADSIFGSPSPAQFSDPEKLEDLVTQYLARAQIQSIGTGSSSAAIALTLLQS